jgi:hypothetical protein
MTVKKKKARVLPLDEGTPRRRCFLADGELDAAFEDDLDISIRNAR